MKKLHAVKFLFVVYLEYINFKTIFLDQKYDCTGKDGIFAYPGKYITLTMKWPLWAK